MTQIVQRLSCFVALFLLCAVPTFAQRQICANAHNLIDKSPLSVPSVAWSPTAAQQKVGCFQDSLHQPYWIKFTALTSGTFEFALTPKNLAADYDFVLYSEACPCDTTTTNVVACNWLGWVTQLFGATGIANDPYQKFNIKDTLAWAEFERTVQLKVNTNYYLLVDNITNNGVGFDMQFGGTAQIGKALPEPVPTITAIEGKTNICNGAAETYTVKSNVKFKDYQWIVPEDAVISGVGESVQITWGKKAGTIKVFAKTTCASDSFSLTVNNNTVDLAYLDKNYFCKNACFETNNLKIKDLGQNTNTQFDIYNNADDAWKGTLKNLANEYLCKAQTFWIRGTSPNTCFDTLQVAIREVENPSVVLLGGGVACPGDTVSLNFSFTGKAPFKVTYNDGQKDIFFTTNNNIYSIKNVVNQDIIYKVVSFSESSNLCQTSIIGDAKFYTPANCICLKRAGTMNPFPIEACSNIAAKSQHNNDHQIGSNDGLAFILHSTPTPELGTVYATAAKPEFDFKGGLMYGKQYYISSIVGVKKMSGDINLSDPCLGISAGVPIMFHEPPTAKLFGDSLICDNGLTELLLQPEGNGPFQVEFEANAVTQELAILKAIKITGVPLGTYLIRSITDVNGCVRKNTDTVVVKKPNPLTIKNKKMICDASNLTYYVTFEVEGGKANTYFSEGKKGIFTKNIFKSEAISSGKNYTFMVKDAAGCDSTLVTGVFVCDCSEKSTAGTMNSEPIVICASLSATASYQNDAKLAPNHVLGFVLKDSLGNVLGYNKNIPNFKMEAGMKTDYAYFISAAAGQNDGTGKVNLASTCTVFSNPSFMTFVNEPSAFFTSSDKTVCKNELLDLKITLTGTPSFDLVYKENDDIKTLKNITQKDVLIAVKPSYSMIYTLLEVRTGGCKGSIAQGSTMTVAVADTVVYRNLKVNCAADRKSFTVSFDMTSFNSDFVINNLPFSGDSYTSAAFQDGAAYQFELSNSLRCTPIKVSGKGFCTCLPDSKMQITKIVNLRCHGDKNGMLEATTNVKAPYQFTWNTGRIGSDVSNLKAGLYIVTVTNNESCSLVDSVRLLEPAALSATIETVSPKCFGDKNGEIMFENVSGGTPPYLYSIDNKSFINSFIFDKLKPLAYEVIVKDARGCRFETTATIEEPEDFYVELGTDVHIGLGEEVQLRAYVNGTAKSIQWNMPTLKKDVELVKPMATTKYEVTAESVTGCKFKDFVWVYVNKNREVYGPNVFSPNGDNVNDSFTLYAGKSVSKITNFRIFDRWGNLIYELPELQSGDETMGWQGTYRNYIANEGTYLYAADVLYLDGKMETINGDVQLVK